MKSQNEFEECDFVETNSKTHQCRLSLFLKNQKPKTIKFY